MIKKLFFALILFCFSFTLTVNAQSISQIEPQEAFYTLDEDKEKVAEIINIPYNELESYCKENRIEYLAVNSDNSKQIRLTTSITDFSNSIVNISLLSNDKISALIPDITGISGARGDIIDKNGQKFIKTEFRTSDSGGNFILTQYFTVADKQTFNLSFYTTYGSDTEYIEKTFESFNNDSFITTYSAKNQHLGIILPICAIVLAAICIVVSISIVKDLQSVKISKPNN